MLGLIDSAAGPEPVSDKEVEEFKSSSVRMPLRPASFLSYVSKSVFRRSASHRRKEWRTGMSQSTKPARIGQRVFSQELDFLREKSLRKKNSSIIQVNTRISSSESAIQKIAVKKIAEKIVSRPVVGTCRCRCLAGSSDNDRKAFVFTKAALHANC